MHCLWYKLGCLVILAHAVVQLCRYRDDAEDSSGCQDNKAADIVGLEAIKEHQALVQEATCFTLTNSRVASIVRVLRYKPFPGFYQHAAQLQRHGVLYGSQDV